MNSIKFIFYSALKNQLTYLPKPARLFFPGKYTFLLVCYCVCLFHVCHAQIRLPRLVRDSMVLQRDVPLKIWGWASANEKVQIVFNGKKYKTHAGSDGKWAMQLLPMKAGGPYSMRISGRTEILLKDILIGDVWLCSGQSNMVHQMELHSVRYANDIMQANYPEIRQFWIPTLTSLQGPRMDLPAGFWKSANPEDVRQFSAVAYFFAKQLYDKYKIPIGIINASVGGTPVEAWTSEEGLKPFPAIVHTIEKNKDTAYVNEINRQALAANHHEMALRPADKGLTGALTWYNTGYIPKEWNTINIPGYWEDQGNKDLNGIVWYRKEINLPATMNGVAATVFLGRIVDADVFYINGQQTGATGYQYPQRRYKVAAGILKTGKNIFVIKVTNTSGKGGFVPGKPYCLFAGNDTIDLKGYWQYKVGAVFSPHGNAIGSISAQNQPAALYNAMIAPLINYNIKGVCWYQGETNAGNPTAYSSLLPALISNWRSLWNNDHLPFLFVQLPNFMDVNYHPSESQWAELREAQLKALSVPNTGMAVAIDLGEWNDIHPDNKKDVGERLALVAQHVAYGENIVYSGPLYQSSVAAENKIIVSFTNTGSGLVARNGEALQAFAIAGADKKFVWANAVIEGDKVVVSSDLVPRPLYVRYAWADNPEGANLYNKEGLPASPFQNEK
ncbi:MAG: sialate O-acetylesterase [Bacteroidota bacterium]